MPLHTLLSPLLASAIGLGLLTPGASMALELEMPVPAQQVRKLQDTPWCAAAGSGYSSCEIVLLHPRYWVAMPRLLTICCRAAAAAGNCAGCCCRTACG
jgi:hypothetical protein